MITHLNLQYCSVFQILKLPIYVCACVCVRARVCVCASRINYRVTKLIKSASPILHHHCDYTCCTVTCHQQPRPMTCGVSSECLGTRSYETTSRDQRGKIQMFFSSTGACTATKSSIANHRSPIIAQLYFASVTQMFLMPLFAKVESDSSKLLRTVSKSGPNGCKERSRPQKILMGTMHSLD